MTNRFPLWTVQWHGGTAREPTAAPACWLRVMGSCDGAESAGKYTAVDTRAHVPANWSQHHV
jgi:hypothetical protein